MEPCKRELLCQLLSQSKQTLRRADGNGLRTQRPLVRAIMPLYPCAEDSLLDRRKNFQEPLPVRNIHLPVPKKINQFCRCGEVLVRDTLRMGGGQMVPLQVAVGEFVIALPSAMFSWWNAGVISQ